MELTSNEFHTLLGKAVCFTSQDWPLASLLKIVQIIIAAHVTLAPCNVK